MCLFLTDNGKNRCSTAAQSKETEETTRSKAKTTFTKTVKEQWPRP